MNTLENMLVPLDGSPLAEAALPYAKALAGRVNGKLTLVRAAHYASLLGDVAIDQYHAIEQAEDYLNGLVKQLGDDGYTAQAGVPFGGSTAEWIVEESDIRHTDLVIMATHDRVGFDRLVHGSVAETVVHRSRIPVMLVRGTDAEQLAGRIMDLQPILIVPLDGSELAETALPVATELAGALGGRVVLVGVTTSAGEVIASEAGAIVAYTAGEVGDMQASVRRYLEEVGQGQTDVEVRSGDAATEIAQVAREYSAAAVVMATHGRTGVMRSLLGSVAGGVLHHTPVPVILVRARAEKVAARQRVAQTSSAPAD